MAVGAFREGKLKYCFLEQHRAKILVAPEYKILAMPEEGLKKPVWLKSLMETICFSSLQETSENALNIILW